jgi:hypothetical protein
LIKIKIYSIFDTVVILAKVEAPKTKIIKSFLKRPTFANGIRSQNLPKVLKLKLSISEK